MRSGSFGPTQYGKQNFPARLMVGARSNSLLWFPLCTFSIAESGVVSGMESADRRDLAGEGVAIFLKTWKLGKFMI